MWYAPLTNDLRALPDRSFVVPLHEPEHHSTNHAVIPGTGGLRWVYDSTSLRLLQGCLRKANWVLNDGWTEAERPIALAWGIHFHTCMEVFHKCLSHGLDYELATHRVARLAALLGETLMSLDTSRTKETLIRSVVWYLDQYRDDPLQTAILPDGKPAVELSFMLPVFDLEVEPTHELPELDWQDVLSYCNGNTELAIKAVAQGRKLFGSLTGTDNEEALRTFYTITIFFAGHLDRVVHFDDEVYISDYKSSKYTLDASWAASFDMSLQFKGYYTAATILASQPNSVFPRPPAGILVDGIQLQVNATRFARFPLRYFPSTANEFLENFEMLVRAKVEPAARLGFWPPEAESECNAYRRKDGTGGCPFVKVCQAAPGDRTRLLKQHFRVTQWDPSRSR